MRRREFIAGLGAAGACATVPRLALGQQDTGMRRLAMLVPGDEDQSITSVAIFLNELAKLGWVEGRNLRIDLRHGSADADRFRSYAAELVGLAPDVIVTVSGAVTTAVQRQTQAIPIVFLAVGDPVASGVVKNIARPEGNATGVTNLFDSIAGKWVELLKEALPSIANVGMIYNARLVVPGAGGYGYLLSIEEAARAIGVQAIRIPYRDAIDIVRGIDAFAAAANGGLIVVPPVSTSSDRKSIHRLAAEHRLPDIQAFSSFAAEGGLMTYGSDSVALLQRGSYFVDRILRGAKVSELPVEFPTTFKLVVNMKTAKAIGLSLPESLLLRADEVIE